MFIFPDAVCKKYIRGVKILKKLHVMAAVKGCDGFFHVFENFKKFLHLIFLQGNLYNSCDHVDR